MGRTFENRKNAMAKRGDRDAKAFTRCGRQIHIAVKSGGSDPAANPALRRAIQNARDVSMPKDKIQNAIKKATGAADTSNFEQILYEGYGPHGVPMMVETATDNPTRTVANIRAAFKKENGNMGTTGSVAFMFDQYGAFRLKPGSIDRDELELELIDYGLEAFEEGVNDKGDVLLIVRCNREEFGNMQTALEEREVEVASSGFEWVPRTTAELTNKQVDDVLRLVDRFEQDDDVQEVFHNISAAQ